MYWSLMNQAPKTARPRTASTTPTTLPDLDPMMLVSRSGQAELQGAGMRPAPRPSPEPAFDVSALEGPATDYGIEFSTGEDIELAERPRGGMSQPRFRVDRPPTMVRYEPGPSQNQDGRVVGNIHEGMGRTREAPRQGTPIAEVRATARTASTPTPPRGPLPTAYDRIAQMGGDDDPFS